MASGSSQDVSTPDREKAHFTYSFSQGLSNEGSLGDQSGMSNHFSGKVGNPAFHGICPNSTKLQTHQSLSMYLPKGKHLYFASDFHLGIPDRESSLVREKRICQWLDQIQDNAHTIFLVGDLFDVWFEYRRVVPRGYVRFLGKLAELSDGGVSIEVFTGNHDLWMDGYFEHEMGIPVHKGPIQRTFNDKKFLIGHGDGLGPGDRGYKLLKALLSHPFAQRMYRLLHPNIGIGLAGWLSGMGPKHLEGNSRGFQGEEKEWLVQFALERQKTDPMDYYIFGHRHIAITYPLPKGGLYLNLGDWISLNTFACFDGDQLELRTFNTDNHGI